MGGFRKSDIAFRQEQAKKLRLVRDIKRSQDSIGGLRVELDRILSTTTAGIRETFGDGVRAAGAWRVCCFPLRGARQDRYIRSKGAWGHWSRH